MLVNKKMVNLRRPRSRAEGCEALSTAQEFVAWRKVSLEGGCPERKGAVTCVTSPFSSPATPLSRAASAPAPQGPMHKFGLALVGSFRLASWLTLRQTPRLTIRSNCSAASVADCVGEILCLSRNHLEGGCPERKGAVTCVTSPFSSPATPLSRAAPPGPAGAHARIKTRPGRFVSFRHVANPSRNASDHKATDARRVLVLFAGSSCPPL